MKISSIYSNITIKQANIFTVLVIFTFTMVFVALLVEEMYEDYEKALQSSYTKSIENITEDKILEEKHKKLKTLTIKTVLVIVTLTFILLAIYLGLNNIFNRLLNHDTQTFLDFFERAAHNDQVINPNTIFFQDFKIMIGFANEMVIKINKQKNALLELNVGLEDRVKTKMEKLEYINKNLQEEKKFSQELLDSQKEFLRYTVHETNTPLSVILTSIELYTMKHPKDKQLLKIEVAVKNIFSIYDDLSYLVKKDQVSYPKVVINLNEYLSSRIDFFTDVAQLSHLRFSYQAEIGDSHIYINETKLQRIVDNTITNAIKYTLPEEEVLITLKRFGASVELSVGSKSKIIKDTNKVFDAYYREDSNRDGFGLGLRLVRNICDDEKIDVEVVSNDEKTIFKYRFKMMGE